MAVWWCLGFTGDLTGLRSLRDAERKMQKLWSWDRAENLHEPNHIFGLEPRLNTKSALIRVRTSLHQPVLAETGETDSWHLALALKNKMDQEEIPLISPNLCTPRSSDRFNLIWNSLERNSSFSREGAIPCLQQLSVILYITLLKFPSDDFC